VGTAGPCRADGGPDAHQHGTGNFELFLSLLGVAHDGANAVPERHEDNWGTGDLVFAGNHGRWRALGEYHFGPRENDMERFQVGWEPVPDTLLWFGRFHQPGSAWNNEFHHGQHLQTTITRPAIEAWEDEEGLVPQHLTGTLFESRQPIGAVAGLQLSVGVAYGSVLTDEGLSPVDLLRVNHGSHRLSETARISFLPQYLGSSSAGLLFGHHHTPVADPAHVTLLGAQLVDQHVYGAYFNVDREPWRAMGAAYYIDVDLQNPAAGRREHFASGYVQLERQLKHGVTLFARHENSADASGSRYVSIHSDDFIVRGTLAGLRWDFWRRQALTLELSRVTTILGIQSTARVQWSSVIP
jgi:hypothetical protein